MLFFSNADLTPSKSLSSAVISKVPSSFFMSSAPASNPLERNPKSVLEDYRNELISLETAKKVYGVVIDENKIDVDREATRKLRKEGKGAELTKKGPYDVL